MARLKEIFGSKEDLRKCDSGGEIGGDGGGGSRKNSRSSPALSPTKAAVDAKGFLAIPGQGNRTQAGRERERMKEIERERERSSFKCPPVYHCMHREGVRFFLGTSSWWSFPVSPPFNSRFYTYRGAWRPLSAASPSVWQTFPPVRFCFILDAAKWLLPTHVASQFAFVTRMPSDLRSGQQKTLLKHHGLRLRPIKQYIATLPCSSFRSHIVVRPPTKDLQACFSYHLLPFIYDIWAGSRFPNDKEVPPLPHSSILPFPTSFLPSRTIGTNLKE